MQTNKKQPKKTRRNEMVESCWPTRRGCGAAVDFEFCSESQVVSSFRVVWIVVWIVSAAQSSIRILESSCGRRADTCAKSIPTPQQSNEYGRSGYRGLHKNPRKSRK